MCFSHAERLDYCDHMADATCMVLCFASVGGVLHTYRHGLASVERADCRLSLGVCGELHKSAA